LRSIQTTLAPASGAGPFDVGTVVVRQQLVVDPVDAHADLASDPLPTIPMGIPSGPRSWPRRVGVLELGVARGTQLRGSPLSPRRRIGRLAGHNA
jgi:hypothetical protein